MNATVLTTGEQLRALVPAWHDLLGRTRESTLSVTPLWLLNWWQVYGGQQGRRLCCVAFHEGDRLVGLAPLNARLHWYRPALPFRRIEFLATGERLEEAVCSDYLNIVAEMGREQEVAGTLAEVLHGGRLGAWDELVLETLAGDGTMPELLAIALQRPRHSVTREEYDRSPAIRLPGTWPEYLAGLDKKHRKFATQTLRNLEEWRPGQIQLHLADSPETLEQGKAILIELHHHRWAGTGKGTFHAARFRAFHDRIMSDLLAEGNLLLAWLTVAEQPVAAAYATLHAGKVEYYQAGRRLDVPEKVRAGIALLLKLIELAILRGQREFDFLPGVAQYKQQLANTSRPIIRLRVARPTWAEAIRRWSRRMLGRGPSPGEQPPSEEGERPPSGG